MQYEAPQTTKAAVALLAKDGHLADFIKDQYRHGKTVCALGASKDLLLRAGVSLQLPDGREDPGIIIGQEFSDVTPAFIAGIARHRHAEREMQAAIG